MRVLHVITGLGAGGAEQQLRLLCRHHGPDVEVEVAVLAVPGAVGDLIRAEGTPVHAVPMAGNRDLRAVLRLARLMRRGRFDCVHTHLFRAGLHGRLAARLAGVPRIVATEHSLNEHVIEGRPTTRPGLATLYRCGEALGHVSIAVSRSTRDRMRAWRVPAAKIVVVPNGVDAAAVAFSPAARDAARRRWAIPAGAYVVGTAARLVALKRIDVLLDALARRPEVHGLVVGDGAERTALEQRCADLGIADRVVFTGETGDVAAALAAMDLFVSCGPQETYGLAMIEALAAGLPLLYVRCPALEERPAADAPAATRIEGTVDDVAAGIARAPRTDRVPAPVVATYDIREVVRTVEELYRGLPVRSPAVPWRRPLRARSSRPHRSSRTRPDVAATG
ncbi:glycosyltransferase [Actinomycetospora chiangmaiensis]|uniref:glycosyltransferase n=1 Tax=Actinomycetospora chiangmaiensis TaxID=402650 RepID=UPI00036C24EB|nr:glycosyltransferase [Actinomycetospora chiangmaiensis]